MRGERRKLIAIVMTLALVVLGITYTPKSISAGTAYSGGVWTPSGTSTWRVNSAKGGEYSGGSSLGDTFSASVSAYSAWDWDFQIKSPVVSVDAGVESVVAEPVVSGELEVGGMVARKSSSASKFIYSYAS